MCVKYCNFSQHNPTQMDNAVQQYFDNVTDFIKNGEGVATPIGYFAPKRKWVGREGYRIKSTTRHFKAPNIYQHIIPCSKYKCVRSFVDLFPCCKRQKLVIEYHMGETPYKKLNEQFGYRPPMDVVPRHPNDVDMRPQFFFHWDIPDVLRGCCFEDEYETFESDELTTHNLPHHRVRWQAGGATYVVRGLRQVRKLSFWVLKTLRARVMQMFREYTAIFDE